MRNLFCITLLFFSQVCRAQLRFPNFYAIDSKMSSLTADTPDSLAKKITQLYATDLEKTRAIFGWITQHISYNTGIFNSGSKNKKTGYTAFPEDSAAVWKSAEEMTAIRVMKKGSGICDGYTKLFKTVCDYAGLKSEIITGYACGYQDKKRVFKTNHSWNAVMIEGVWYLLDVTWGSGYLDYSNTFIQSTDEFYFLTPPQEFVKTHYPEDLQWTLLPDPPTVKEFQSGPFKYRSFVKYGIRSFSPSTGIIEARVGDTIRIEIKVTEDQKNISADPFFDSAILFHSPAWVFLSPQIQIQKSTALYTYVIPSANVEWLHILYNDDLIMRYKLSVRPPALTYTEKASQ
jgi:transglutaminase/protease-like cytokinesis protein 3